MEKSKKDFYIELALFLILGILIGVAVKMEAAKRVAIGFDDYKMEIESQDYDINKLQEDLLLKEMEEVESEDGAPIEEGQIEEKQGGQTAPEEPEPND